jgi:hypothetical protein
LSTLGKNGGDTSVGARTARFPDGPLLSFSLTSLMSLSKQFATHFDGSSPPARAKTVTIARDCRQVRKMRKSRGAAQKAVSRTEDTKPQRSAPG